MTATTPRFPDDGLRRACLDMLDTALDVTAADFADIRLIDPDTGRLRLVAQRGFPAAWEEFWAADTPGPGLCLIAARRGARVVVEDIEDSQLIAQMASTKLLRRFGVRGLQSTPIATRSGEVLGTFSTHSRAAFIAEPKALRLLDLLARQIGDRIEWGRTADALEQAESRRRFFAELENALRPLAHPVAIEYEACRRLAEKLDVARVYFMQIDEEARSLRIDGDFVRAGAASIAGTHRMADHAWAMPILRKGETIAIGDLPNSAIVPDPALPALERLNTVAVVSVPLVKMRRLVGALNASDFRKRNWTTTEIELVRDVSERIWATCERAHAEATRRESEALFRQIFEQSPVGIAIVRAGAGFTNVNESFARILGWDATELLHRQPSEFFHPDEHAASVAATHRLEDSGSGSFRMTSRYIHRSGRAVWVDKWVGLIPDARCFVVIATDITARRLDDALRARTQQLEALGQLTGGIAHDFNNLLQIISLNLESAGMRRTASGRRHALSMAMAAVDQGGSLTRRLLSFARRTPFKPTRIVPNDRVRDVAALLRRSLGEQIEIRTTPAPEAWMVEADAGEIDNALINLAINARDAMPAGGTLVITVENVTFDDQTDRHAELAPGPYVRITLADTGTGMSPEVLRRATEPFFTTKPHGHGTGLGLSSVYGFARQSGGGLDIASEIGRGTTVSLLLPRASATESTPAEPGPGDMPAGRGERILVVEDNDQLRHAIAERLRELAYEIREVDRGAGAIAMLEADPAIRLVLTDVTLPGGLDGFAIADWIGAHRPDVKVLLVSGNMLTDLRRETHGQLRFMTKPYHVTDLAYALRALLEEMP